MRLESSCFTDKLSSLWQPEQVEKERDALVEEYVSGNAFIVSFFFAFCVPLDFVRDRFALKNRS